MIGKNNKKIAPSRKLTETDILEIKRLYKCSETTTNNAKTTKKTKSGISF